MKTQSMWKIALAVLIGVQVPQLAHAILIDRGAGFIYDSDQDVTFLRDARAVGAEMTYDDAFLWAQDLSFAGFDDWRLPRFFFECVPGEFDVPGYNCPAGSELSYLYYTVLGNAAIQSGGPTSAGPFYNLFGLSAPGIYHLQEDGFTPPPLSTFFFNFDTGRLGGEVRGFTGYAWAVREGDVATVPEPGTLGLLGIGFVGLAAGLRKSRRRAVA